MKRVQLRLSVCTAFGVLLCVVMSANGAEVAYHFDRNAFAGTARAGDGAYVALTDTGNLPAFDPATYALLAERVPRSPATCLSTAGGGVVAGLDDGRIVSVEVPSLTMKRIGAVDGRPAWMGRRRSGAQLVARPPVHEGIPQHDAAERGERHSAAAEQPQPQRLCGAVRAVDPNRVPEPDRPARRVSSATVNLRVDAPLPRREEPPGHFGNQLIDGAPSPANTNGAISRRERLGGLLNFYTRAA
jgi:hypothetical protein